MACPKLFINKESSVCYACIGETITYTIYSTNAGDIVLSDVIIRDLLSPNLKFIPNSIVVDGVSKPNLNIISGINLGTLDLDQTKVITFSAKISSKESTIIENTAIGEYTFSIDPLLPSRSGSDKSNVSTVYVRKVNILINKTANKENVVLGDKLTYIITLTNDGDVDANSVVFYDDLPKELVLIDGTFTINGITVNSVDLSQGINVGTIKASSTVILQFDVEVISGNCRGSITNTGNVTFNYILPDGSTGSNCSATGQSTTNTINVALTTFKQLSIDEYLKIPDIKPDIEEINSIDAEIKIRNCHIIETPKKISTEGQILTGYKLIVHGVLKQVIQYTALEPEQSVHSAHYDVPFSNFIILPENFNVGCKVDVSGIVEDIYYHVINPRCFFKNVSVLLQAKILE